METPDVKTSLGSLREVFPDPLSRNQVQLRLGFITFSTKLMNAGDMLLHPLLTKDSRLLQERRHERTEKAVAKLAAWVASRDLCAPEYLPIFAGGHEETSTPEDPITPELH